jgi:hypothetical protein
VATDDQQVRVTGIADAPASYLIPGNGQIAPKAVFASFDGTGAAGAFKPALKITSDGGELIGIYPTDSTVAAGGSADVSWAPFLGRGGGSATGAVVSGFRQFSNIITPQVFGPAGGHPLFFSNGTFITNDSTVFSIPDTFRIEIANGGMLRVDGGVTFNSDTGSPYAGVFSLFTEVADATSTVVQDLVGPMAYEAEVYSTDVGDSFSFQGTSTVNADPAVYTPPFTARLLVQVSQSVSLYGAVFQVSVENPAGLE